MTEQYKANQDNKQLKRWVVELEADGEDLILPLSPEILEATGWKTGDTLLWEQKAGNAWTLRKKP